MTRLDAIGIIVSDMAASIEFYRRLGVEFPDKADLAAEGHVESTLPGGIRLMFDTVEVVKSFDEEWTPPSGGHRIGIAFLCDSPAGLDSLHAELLLHGVESYKDPWDAFWGQRYAQIKDPDGNVIDLFAPLQNSGG